jgi:hypothetical protein
MVRRDTSDSNSKTIHLINRKAVEAYNTLRDKKVNLSELISNFLIQTLEKEEQINRHQALSKPVILSPLANCSIDNGNGKVHEEELQPLIPTKTKGEQIIIHRKKHDDIIVGLHNRINEKKIGMNPYEKMERIQDLIDYCKTNSDTCFQCAEELEGAEERLMRAQEAEEYREQRQEWERVQKAQELEEKQLLEKQNSLETELKNLEEERGRVLEQERTMKLLEQSEKQKAFPKHMRWIVEGKQGPDPETECEEMWKKKWEDYDIQVVKPFAERYVAYKQKAQLSKVHSFAIANYRNMENKKETCL